MVKQYTKELIKEKFKLIAAKKPFNEITVSEIAKECEINRNTFYYHYEDIYDLLKDLLNDELNKIDQQFNETLSWEESFLEAAKFILENKSAVYNIFQSSQRQMIYNYIFNVCGQVMRIYIETLSKNKEINASNEDKKLIAYFYQAALTGIVVKWIDEKMKDEPEYIVRKLGTLFDGNVERSLKISEKLNN